MSNPKYKTTMPNGMFARCHELGEAIWFYLWCVDRTTREAMYENDETRYGSVLGGMPVRTAIVAADFPQIREWTINEWRKKCVEAGVLRTKRTPVGYVIEVVDSTKFNSKPAEKRNTWATKGNSVVGKTPSPSNSDVGKTQTHSESELGNPNIRVGESPNHSPSELGNPEVHIERTV